LLEVYEGGFFSRLDCIKLGTACQLEEYEKNMSRFPQWLFMVRLLQENMEGVPKSVNGPVPSKNLSICILV
jgi:hypothetical protein